MLVQIHTPETVPKQVTLYKFHFSFEENYKGISRLCQSISKAQLHNSIRKVAVAVSSKCYLMLPRFVRHQKLL